MPRKPRSFSNSGYMHLIIRGVGKQVIFEDQKDYAYFLKILERFSQEADISILAYCLMENHVHLLVFDPQGHTSFMMKKLEVSYAYFFNQKYKRVGHLFQNRFLNENINSEESLLRVFRYILNNPVKAGICPAHAYPWSSYALYEEENTFIDTSFIRELAGDSSQMNAFLQEPNEDDYLEDITPFHDDKWAKSVITETLGIENGFELRSYQKKSRDEALEILKREGLTLRQIERLTGISKSVVQRA